MKLVSFLWNGKETAGVMSLDESGAFPFPALGFPYDTMNDFILEGGAQLLPRLREKLSAAGAPPCKAEEITLLAPIPRPDKDVICLGVNFMEHAAESARYKGEAFSGERPYPVYFYKRVPRATDPGQPIDGHFDLTSALDYEVELALVLGKEAKHVSPENAFDHILGYTVLNDVSARDLQFKYGQYFFGKSLDTFCPMGPYIVTEDCFERPPILKLTSHVNGELRQNSSTELMIFDIPYIISELSRGMTLKAGTIISTGTPSGVGMGFKPPKYLKSGDTVTCTVEGVGQLTNTVK